MDQEHDYRITLCRSDGTTPLGQTVRVNVMAINRMEAMKKAFDIHPDHEVVSLGWESEIAEFERRRL